LFHNQHEPAEQECPKQDLAELSISSGQCPQTFLRNLKHVARMGHAGKHDGSLAAYHASLAGKHTWTQDRHQPITSQLGLHDFHGRGFQNEEWDRQITWTIQHLPTSNAPKPSKLSRAIHLRLGQKRICFGLRI
jgi:hypothetical protein